MEAYNRYNAQTGRVHRIEADTAPRQRQTPPDSGGVRRVDRIANEPSAERPALQRERPKNQGRRDYGRQEQRRQEPGRQGPFSGILNGLGNFIPGLGSLGGELGGFFKNFGLNINLGGLETEDYIIMLILYLMYRESGDSELLIALGAMLFF